MYSFNINIIHVERGSKQRSFLAILLYIIYREPLRLKSEKEILAVKIANHPLKVGDPFR